MGNSQSNRKQLHTWPKCALGYGYSHNCKWAKTPVVTPKLFRSQRYYKQFLEIQSIFDMKPKPFLKSQKVLLRCHKRTLIIMKMTEKWGLSTTVYQRHQSLYYQTVFSSSNTISLCKLNLKLDDIFNENAKTCLIQQPALKCTGNCQQQRAFCSDINMQQFGARGKGRRVLLCYSSQIGEQILADNWNELLCCFIQQVTLKDIKNSMQGSNPTWHVGAPQGWFQQPTHWFSHSFILIHPTRASLEINTGLKTGKSCHSEILGTN